MNFSDLSDAFASFVAMLSPELAMFGLGAVFLALAVLTFMWAMGAVGGARRARDEAQEALATVQRYADEMRLLANDQASMAASQGACDETLSERIQSVNVGSIDGSFADEAAATEAVASDAEAAPVEENVSDEVSLEAEEIAPVDDDARLADAARAATEPRSLLSGMLRRR